MHYEHISMAAKGENNFFAKRQWDTVYGKNNNVSNLSYMRYARLNKIYFVP